MRGSSLAFALAALLSSTLALPRAAADPYDDALAQAASLAGAGRPADGARALEAVLPAYPQDYALPVEIGRLHLAAGDLAAAERFYRLAAQRSPTGPEARLGLAVVRERQGRCAEARALYEALSREQPDLSAAREGAARCASTWTLTPEVAFLGGAYPGHPARSYSAGFGVGASFGLHSGFFLGGLYRMLHFWAPSGSNGHGNGNAGTGWNQHEAHVSTGFDGKLGGVGLHYAFVRESAGVEGRSHHGGISLRYSPYGDIDLAATVSVSPSSTILRVEHGYRLPLFAGVSVRPAVAVASVGAELLPTAMLTLSYDHRRFRLYAGGKVGKEIRAYYLRVPVVNAFDDPVAWGAWGGGSVNVGDHARIHLGYATDRLQLSDGTQVSAHALSLGAAFPF